MNSPEQIKNDSADAARSEELTQQPADDLLEIEPEMLEQVVGGGDGTAIGIGKD